MNAVRGCAPLLLVSLVTCGCLDVVESIRLKKNLSGEGSVVATLDLDQYARSMLLVLSGMSIKEPSKLSPEETSKLVKELEQDETSLAGLWHESEDAIQTLVASFPAGVHRTGSSSGRSGESKWVVRVDFTFDDVAKLRRLRAAVGTLPTVYVDPFEGLEVNDDGHEVVLTRSLHQGQEACFGALVDEPEGARVRRAGDCPIRVAFQLEAPFHIIDANATRNEGAKLVWDFDAQALRPINAERRQGFIPARFKR